MSFRPRMTCFTEGIRPTEPLRFGSWPGIVGDLWQAQGLEGGGGHYVSPDPRLVLFLRPAGIELSASPGFERRVRSRLCFIPAGMPIWSRMRKDQTFRHLDLHFHSERLAARVGTAALTTPMFRDAGARVLKLAHLLAAEITAGARDGLQAESLIHDLLDEIFLLGPSSALHGLTDAQLRRLDAFMMERLDQPVSIADLAGAVNLSEGWFAHAFKRATGDTPHRWQLRLRIDKARDMLLGRAPIVEIAHRTGFSDQAHLTRCFRGLTGTTPAVWRRENSAVFTHSRNRQD